MRRENFKKMFGGTPNNSLGFKSYDFDSFLFWHDMSDRCCVYLYSDHNGRVLYAGQSCNAPGKRWIQHLTAWSGISADEYLMDQITDIYWIYCDPSEVNLAETVFIDYFDPPLNKRSGNTLRVDKKAYEKIMSGWDAHPEYCSNVSDFFDHTDLIVYWIPVHEGADGYEKVSTRYGKYIRFCLDELGIEDAGETFSYDNLASPNILVNRRNLSTIRFVNDFAECEDSLLELDGTGCTTFIMPAENLFREDIPAVPDVMNHLAKMTHDELSQVCLYVHASYGSYGRLIFIDGSVSAYGYAGVPVKYSLDDTGKVVKASDISRVPQCEERASVCAAAG